MARADGACIPHRAGNVPAVVFADIYLQPQAPDPVLDEGVIVEAARRHVPDAGPLLAVDESGGEARAYLLGGDVVVKTQRPHRLRPRTNLAKEAFVLAELHRRGAFPVPRALGHGRVRTVEYLCLTRIPGSALRSGAVEPDDRRRALSDLGRILRALHDLDQSAFGRSELLPGDRSPADLRVRVADIFTRLAAAFDADRSLGAAVDVRRVAAERLDATPDDVAPVCLHSNPGPEHTFIDVATGAFTGLIDFGDAYRSHPAFDFRPWTDRDDAAAVLDGYRSAGPLSPHFDEVRRTVLVIAALARAARGATSPDDLAAALDLLLG